MKADSATKPPGKRKINKSDKLKLSGFLLAQEWQYWPVQLKFLRLSFIYKAEPLHYASDSFASRILIWYIFIVMNPIETEHSDLSAALKVVESKVLDNRKKFNDSGKDRKSVV